MEDKFVHKDPADNMLAIHDKLKECLKHNPTSADANGLAVMGIALLLERVAGCNVFAQVREFHKKMGIKAQGGQFGVKQLSAKALEFRMCLLKEEYTEYVTAVADKDVAGQFDALLDIISICCGTISLAGWDGEEGWKRVHNSNMQKEPSVKPTKRSLHTGEVDVIKPKSWQPPVLSDLI